MVLALLLCGWAVKTYRTSQLKPQAMSVPVTTTNGATNGIE